MAQDKLMFLGHSEVAQTKHIYSQKGVEMRRVRHKLYQRYVGRKASLKRYHAALSLSKIDKQQDLGKVDVCIFDSMHGTDGRLPHDPQAGFPGNLCRDASPGGASVHQCVHAQCILMHGGLLWLWGRVGSRYAESDDGSDSRIETLPNGRHARTTRDQPPYPSPLGRNTSHHQSCSEHTRPPLVPFRRNL